MKVEVQHHGSVSVVAPRDALTESTTDDLRAALGAEQPQGAAVRRAGVRLVLDLSNAPFVDSAGIEFLLEVAGNPSDGAMRPRLAGLTETVREALYLTDTQKRFQVFDSVEGAVRSFV